MTDRMGKGEHDRALRRRAEDRLAAVKPDTADAAGRDPLALIHELQVHQIELEMQNEDLQRANREVEELRQRYQDLYDFAPVGYLTLDERGTVIESNLAVASLLGCERHGLVNRPFPQFIAPESSVEFELFRRRVFSSEAQQRCEVRLGEHARAEWALLDGKKVAGEREKQETCRVTLLDVTERKRAEVEIRRLASFPLMNPNPVLELDANGQMIFCNPAAKQVLENAGYTDGTNPLIPQDMPVILQCLHDGKAGQFRQETGINDRFFEELIYIEPQFQSVRIYTMDITARKLAEQGIERLNTDLAARAAELEEANRDLEAFNYSVAHDLRKPLTVVNGYCQAVNELCGDKLDEKCRGLLGEAYTGTVRMNRLIDALLAFSRLAHVEPRREKVDLSALARDVAAELMITEPERRVALEIAEGLTAFADANLLRSVLSNLLGNAWKFTWARETGIIQFGVMDRDGQPVYFVRDNGTGFAAEDAEKLFIPFQRLTGASEYKGFGIGLATVERIVRRHGGTTWAEGEPDKGATFYFTLPGRSETGDQK